MTTNPDREQALGGWQTIDTAPRDGTWIEAWRNPPAKYEMGYWEPRVTVRWEQDGSEGAWVWPDGTYEVYTERGRERADIAIQSDDFYADSSFTHWMPLPPAPDTVSTNEVRDE